MADRPTPTGPAAPELSIVESRVYRGGNIWSYSPAIHLVVDLGVLEGYPTDTLDGLHRPARRAAAGPGEPHLLPRGEGRLHRAAARGHLARPRRRARRPAAAAGGRPRPAPRQDPRGQGPTGPLQRHLRLRRRDGRPRGRHPRRAAGQPPRRGRGRLRLPRGARRLPAAGRSASAFGPSTAAILEEAVSRDIPYIRLNSASLVQLGQGVHAQRIRATMTSKTGALAVDIASDKDMTTRLLGVGRPARAQAGDGAHAPTARSPRPGASGSPSWSSRSTATTAAACASTCTSDDEVREAFAVAEGESRRGYVIVESFVTGRDYRCLIVGGRMQAIAERVPAHVIGDGTHTVGRARRDHQRRPAPRRRAREGADPHQGRRRRASTSSRDQGLDAGRRAARGRRWSSSR